MSYDNDDAQAGIDVWTDHYYAARERRNRLESAGLGALPDLIQTALSDTGQSDVCKQFLLGLYDGQSFPFNLNSLRGLDHKLRDAVMTVLDMDTFNVTCEIHERIDGAKKLFRKWAIEEQAQRAKVT